MYFVKSKYKISLEIESKSSMYTSIIRYLATYPNINNFFSNSYTTKENDKEMPLLKIAYKIFKINFNGDKIKIIHKIKRESPKGTSFGVQCYVSLILKSSKKEILEAFVKSAKQYCTKSNNDNVTTKILKDGHWSVLSKLAKRSWETIYLDGNLCNEIKNDIENFINNEEEYIKYGIPYKRNYLFYGLPGTGKTSLIFTIASQLNMGIGIINLGPQINDSRLMDAISDLDDNYILVLEDIDSLFVKRNRATGSFSSLSFSGLLNILDGLGRKHKMITFMTTNYKERLDKALVRAGRIDYQLEFTWAVPNQIQQMFLNILDSSQEVYLKQFLHKCRNLETTTAILQKFFFENRTQKCILDHYEKLKQLSKSDDEIEESVRHIYM